MYYRSRSCRGRRLPGSAAGAAGLACGERGSRYLDYCQACPRVQKIRGPCAIAEGRAAYQQHLGLPRQAGGCAFRGNPAREAR
jgi:hypothetical protein